jgi:glutamyl-tRNA reductase
MSVVAVGLHERDGELDLLASVAISDSDLPKALGELAASSHISEVVIVSTCMRTEVYAVTERFHDGLRDIQRFFENRVQGRLDPNELAERLFVAYDDSAAHHLFNVAAGIDSAVLGEGEILRQVRDAALRARAERVAGPVLEAMFRHAVEVGKRSRSETSIARGVTSLSHVAVELASRHYDGDLAGRRIVVIGAGEMGAGITAALFSAGSSEVVVANRTASRAERIAAEHGARAVSLAEIPVELPDVDVVISAVASDQPVLTVAAVRAARDVSDRPLLVIDAAMPRSIEEGIAAIGGVGVLDLDDIRNFAELQMQARRSEIDGVEVIIAEELERYRANARGREMAPLIAELRAKADLLIEAELARVGTKIDRMGQGGDVVADVARRVVAKLLHEPTVALKDAAGTARGERLGEALRALFDL